MQGSALSVVVVGQIGRDLVLSTDVLPDGGGTAPVQRRIERLGGKGANQALALRQLGVEVAHVGVVGVDPAGDSVLDDAARSGIDVHHVIRCGRTALFVDIVESRGTRRVLEDVPEEALLTVEDVAGAADAFGMAGYISGLAVAALRDEDDPALRDECVLMLAWYHTSTAPAHAIGAPAAPGLRPDEPARRLRCAVLALPRVLHRHLRGRRGTRCAPWPSRCGVHPWRVSARLRLPLRLWPRSRRMNRPATPSGN